MRLVVVLRHGRGVVTLLHVILQPQRTATMRAFDGKKKKGKRGKGC